MYSPLSTGLPSTGGDVTLHQCARLRGNVVADTDPGPRTPSRRFAAGHQVAEQSSTTRPEVAQQPVHSQALGLTVATGRVIGFTDVDTVRTNEGITLNFEMTGRLYLEGEADINDWTVTGEPQLHLSNPAVPTGMTTCTQLVNRIPDVINAPPGFVTIEKLPRLRYRTYPLGAYVHDRGPRFARKRMLP